MDYEQILYEVDDGVARVTLNRPEKLNAMTARMGAEMADVMAEADADDAVLPAARDLARDIAETAAPLPVAISKRLIWEGVGIDFDAWHAREGTVAFLEKRAPRWKGSLSKKHPEELS